MVCSTASILWSMLSMAAPAAQPGEEWPLTEPVADMSTCRMATYPKQASYHNHQGVTSLALLVGVDCGHPVARQVVADLAAHDAGATPGTAH